MWGGVRLTRAEGGVLSPWPIQPRRSSASITILAQNKEARSQSRPRGPRSSADEGSRPGPSPPHLRARRVTGLDSLWLLLAGIGGGLAGSMAGPASVVSYPALLALGLPPVVANVTNNTVSLVFGSVGSIDGFRPSWPVRVTAGSVSGRGRIGPIMVRRARLARCEWGSPPLDSDWRRIWACTPIGNAHGTRTQPDPQGNGVGSNHVHLD